MRTVAQSPDAVVELAVLPRVPVSSVEGLRLQCEDWCTCMLIMLLKLWSLVSFPIRYCLCQGRQIFEAAMDPG
jgi:hypothetical protein